MVATSRWNVTMFQKFGVGRTRIEVKLVERRVSEPDPRKAVDDEKRRLLSLTKEGNE